MSGEFTRMVVMHGNFYRLSFLDFDVNVLEASLSIQGYINLTEYNEVIVKNTCSLRTQECRFEFDTGFGNDY